MSYSNAIGPQGGRNGLLMSLLSLRGIFAFWIVYGLAHAGFRLQLSSTLSLDDSRANELVQNLALGYQVRQPPLYEWLLWGSQQLFGTGIASHLALRYALIAALGLATFGAARAAIRDERWAAIASLSLAFSYPVGWTFHEWATQTIILCIACMASVHVAIRFFERAGAAPAVGLGLALALGFYSKFSYPLFLAALILAALSLAELRARLADPRLLLSAALALVLLSPYLYWLVSVRGDIVGAVASHMIAADVPYWRRAIYGLWRLGISMPLFLMPWLVLVAALAPPAFMRPGAGAPAAVFAERLVLRTMILAAILAAIGIASIGATNIAERYMHAILIVAPLCAFARVSRLVPGEARIRRFAALALGVAALVLGIRFIATMDTVFAQRAARLWAIPYAEFVGEVARRGIADGTALTPHVREAGNLRAFLPKLRVLAADSYRAERPSRRASDERSCILLWGDGQEAIARRLAPIDGLTIERIEVSGPPSRLGAARAGTWFFARLDPKLPACS